MSDLLASKQPEFSNAKDRSLYDEAFHIRMNISLQQKDLLILEARQTFIEIQKNSKVEREIQRLEGENMKL